MEIYWMIVFFVTGSVLGSFFNVVGLRLPKQIAFDYNRSCCPRCNHQLRWYELIPIASYILQKGKCRHCTRRISFIYPFIEFFTGFLFAYSYWHIGLTLELFMSLIFISMLMIVFVSDITYMLIPNKILLFFLPLLLFMRVISPLDPWYDVFIGAVLGLVLIALIIILSKGKMGGGDMKLFAVIGIVLGWKGTLLTLVLASFFGAMIGGIIMMIKKTEKKQPIPFGPYIVITSLISYFYGKDIISIYISIL